MATSKKAVPCRIPTFSTRIPQASSIPQPPVAEPAHHPPPSEITAKHVGKRVCVGEKAGVLKYFGTVHFAKGSWCGIELSNAIGKHDGTVDGVRYFACANHHGLMAPLAKVTLVANTCESQHPNEDNGASGPYSILCLEPKLQTKNNKNNFRHFKSSRNNLNQLESAETTYCRRDLEKDNQNSAHTGAVPKKLDQHLNHSETITIDNLGPRRLTFDIQNNTKSAEDLRRFVLRETSPNRNCSNASLNSIGSLPDDANQFKNSTFKFRSTENICGSQFFDPIEESLLNACNNLTHSAEDLNRTYLNKTLTNNHTREVNTSPTTPQEELANTYIKSDNRNNAKKILQLKEETVSYLANLKRTNDRENENKEIKNPFKAPLAHQSINKSCEYILNDSTLEVKRRRKSNPKCHNKPETNPQTNLTYDKPNSLPRLRSSLHLNETISPRNSLLNLKLFQYSTPVRPDFFDDLAKLRFSDIRPHQDDDSNKRDSLECEESLGILTPDQMADFSQTRSPSLEYNPLLENPIRVVGEEKGLLSPNQENKNVCLIPNNRNLTVNTSRVPRENKEEVQSPNLTSEPSLSIIDVDQMLSGFTRYGGDTTMNLDLPLDSVANNNKDFVLTRGDQTPSPEELPLDTTPIVESEPSKTESTAKSKTSNSFITSITSITSLDTGYQGDGEMSRPASRGADTSPLTRRPFPRPQPRRPDPMTDSDFYTESDADNHEDNQVKGDRRAQVIDGTLYGVDPQAAADIYVNNRENMDSSGIFTDIETRNDDESEGSSNQKQENIVEHVNNVNNQTVIDVSPSESTKTISENSQNNIQDILHQKNNTETSKLIETSSPDKTINKENPKKRNAPSPGISSPSSLSSPRHHHSREENAAKKYKMPKRDVTSKIKAMMEQYPTTPNEKKVIKKPVNKWDAVMNKISKNEQNKTNLKEVKSKVFIGVNKSNSATPKANEQKKPIAEPVLSQSNKSRRIRTRTVHTPSPLKPLVQGNNIESSIHSSLSDISASIAPTKKLPGSAKKRDAIKVTQVLTPNKLTPKNTKTLTEKSSKPTVKGGRTSPSVRPPAPQTPRAPVKRVSPSPRTVEALAVLVQHLVFNVEAYQVPHLKRQVEKFRLESEEVRLAYQHLEETLADEKVKHAAAIEDERVRCRKDITDLIEKHRNQIAQLTSQHADGEQQLLIENETAQQYLTKKHEEQLAILRQELEKLQRSHEESLDILREENDSVREQIDEKRTELEKFNHESLKLKHDYECKEMKLKEEVEIMKNQRDKLKIQIERLENDFEEKLKSLIDENKRLREDNDRFLNYGDDKDIGLQEVQSLRVVLELKLNENAELRKTVEQTKQKLEHLVGAEEKASALQARCEDLQHQLQRKQEYEHTLIQENQKLSESFKEEINQKKRLSQHNEELQWKLKQNKEVMTKVMEQAQEESMFNRSNIYSSSFNEKHIHNQSKLSLERTLSFRESAYNNQSSISLDGSSRGRKSKNLCEFDEDLSPPSSPKVKGVVEKSDSVSYVLDLDESPEVVASRIVRRSFRNTTPPKNTPTKSPSNKRPRIRNPLSMSASSSSILSSNKEECERPRSASARNDRRGDVDDVFLWSNPTQNSPNSYKLNRSSESTPSSIKLDDNLDLDEFNEADLPLPALPNEMDKRNGVLALPSPRRLAGDATDGSSEDESTSSSQL